VTDFLAKYHSEPRDRLRFVEGFSKPMFIRSKVKISCFPSTYFEVLRALQYDYIEDAILRVLFPC